MGSISLQVVLQLREQKASSKSGVWVALGVALSVKIGCDCLYAISPPEAGRSTERGDLAICNTTRVGLPCCAFSVRPPHDTRPGYAQRVSQIATLMVP